MELCPYLLQRTSVLLVISICWFVMKASRLEVETVLLGGEDAPIVAVRIEAS